MREGRRGDLASQKKERGMLQISKGRKGEFVLRLVYMKVGNPRYVG